VKVRQLQRSVRRGLNGLTFAQGRAAVRHGVLPTLEHQAILRALNPSLVADVGANRGQFSLDVRCALPNARVVAFEPLTPEADIYTEIFASTATHVLHRVALGAEAGTASFHVSAARDSSSLLPIGDRQSELFPGTQEVSTQVVEVRTLDDFADELASDGPTLLKIDVQGAELDVLRGAKVTLGSFRWIYLEMSFVELYDGQPLADTIVDELRTRGFELAGTGTPSIIDGRPVQVDALFERSQAPA
jgi:FkbM family methyltransferase